MRDAVGRVLGEARAFRCETRAFVQACRFERHAPSSAGSARTLHLGRLFEPAQRPTGFSKHLTAHGRSPVPRSIVLSEHVDYWNRLARTDAFSSVLFTQRQQDYVTLFHLDSARRNWSLMAGGFTLVLAKSSAASAAVIRRITLSFLWDRGFRLAENKYDNGLHRE